MATIRDLLKKSKEKIDGVAATIMALAEYMTEEKDGDSIYDNRGLLILFIYMGVFVYVLFS